MWIFFKKEIPQNTFCSFVLSPHFLFNYLVSLLCLPSPLLSSCVQCSLPSFLFFFECFSTSSPYPIFHLLIYIFLSFLDHLFLLSFLRPISLFSSSLSFLFSFTSCFSSYFLYPPLFLLFNSVHLFFSSTVFILLPFLTQSLLKAVVKSSGKGAYSFY